jgi:multisubunit Na+/H+ antiporter MnhG subunit
MKSFFGVLIIVFGVIVLFRYPDLGKSAAETLGVIFGVSLITFLPGILLIANDKKKKE